MDLLYGAWTYRSFYNREDPANDIGDLLLAEGELVFAPAARGEVSGQLAFRSETPDPKDPRLSLAGSSEASAPAVARFRGTGVPGTAAEGWVYDYVGYLTEHWPGGKQQRQTLVGSVTRLVDHPGSGGSIRRAGDVYSFVAVRREFPEARTVIPIAEPVLSMLASRHHRLHHLVWHTLRNSWASDDAISPAVKKEISQLGWEPPRPVLSAVGDPLFGNGSGEDFLFMHRQMLIEVKEGLAKAGAPDIKAWATIPPPDAVVTEPNYDENPVALPRPGNPSGFSVPAAWYPEDETLRRRLEALKTPDFYWSRMRWWDRRFKDPAHLSTLTLGELGTLLEWTVHNDMHMRWASVPRDPQTNLPNPNGRPDWDINPAWDVASYDHLGEQYSSHVHPVFWRLHGWVDARIDDWLLAHQAAHPGDVSRKNVMGVPWFESRKWVQVQMPWSGPMQHMHAMLPGLKQGGADPQGDIKIMERIVELVMGPPPKLTKAATLALLRRPSVHERLRSHF